MKILLTNYSLNWLGGTQTWVKTMAAELTRLGHEVHLFAADKQYGLLPQYPQFDPLAHYDLALVNHNICLASLEGCDIDFRIFTSHGIIPHFEQPVLGADRYVAVSEEVMLNMAHKGFSATIIRNPIDTETFKSLRPVNEKLTNVLFMSNYQGDAREVVEKACVGLNLKIFGKTQGQGEQADALTEMNNADVVIALGRTAYEAMACERNVLIYDYNGADGWAIPRDLVEYRRNNCSGRYAKLQLTPTLLKTLFLSYNPKLGKDLREYIIENNNVRTIAQTYLNLRNN